MMSNLIRLFLLIPAIIFGFVGVASAAPDAETAYIFNSFSFLVHGFLVMLMAAGFCMLETGLVRAKNAVVQCAKNIGLYSIAGIQYWACRARVHNNILKKKVDIFTPFVI